MPAARVPVTKPAPIALQSKITLDTLLPLMSVTVAFSATVWPSVISVWPVGYVTFVENITGVELSVKKMNGATIPVLLTASVQETVQL